MIKTEIVNKSGKILATVDDLSGARKWLAENPEYSLDHYWYSCEHKMYRVFIK